MKCNAFWGCVAKLEWQHPMKPQQRPFIEVWMSRKYFLWLMIKNGPASGQVHGKIQGIFTKKRWQNRKGRATVHHYMDGYRHLRSSNGTQPLGDAAISKQFKKGSLNVDFARDRKDFRDRNGDEIVEKSGSQRPQRSQRFPACMETNYGLHFRTTILSRGKNARRFGRWEWHKFRATLCASLGAADGKWKNL